MGSSPHALILPYPAQGHVIPLLELSYCLADRGFDITFVNTDFNHDRVLAAINKTDGNGEMTSRIQLVSVPDGLSPSEDRNDLGRLTQAILNTMPGCLYNLIQSTKSSNKFTCLIADHAMAWAMDVAKKAGLRSALFFPASAGVHATVLSIPKLVQDGIFDEEGVLLTKDMMIQLSPDMPPLNNDHFIWNHTGDDETRRILFNHTMIVARAAAIADFIICNSFYEIEQPVFAYAPNILPIGPLLAGRRFGKPVGHFWPEDTTCTAWLDEQTVSSVVYVAFGSFTVMDQQQFQELALGLELTGKPFLWVVRPDLTNGGSDVYPDGFHERVASRGKMVGWSPQQRVLAHPALACFVSHCGWNSTMEGVTNGIPFLCWPYFADQFLNQSYICDAWKIGVKLMREETGIISKEQIRTKVEMVLNDNQMKERALTLKEKADRSIEKGGSSFENFNSFVEAMKI